MNKILETIKLVKEIEQKIIEYNRSINRTYYEDNFLVKQELQSLYSKYGKEMIDSEEKNEETK